jgi:hypothetical protein
MGANNPNNQLHGFPNEYVVNSNTQNLTGFITIGGAGFGVPTGVSFTGYRSGDRLVCQGSLASGTPAASLGWVQLPTGLTINTPLSTVNPFAQKYGVGFLVAAGATVNIVTAGLIMAVFCDGVNKDRLYFSVRTGAAAYVQDNANALVGAGDRIDFQFDIPIAQWTN